MDNAWIVVLFVVLFGALAAYGILAAAKRRKALEAWAAAQGLSFTAGRERGLEGAYPAFRCLKQGANRYAQNRCEGVYRGARITAFDYHYETYSTDSKGRRQTHHHHFSAVIVASPLPLEPLLVRPEGWFDRVKELFGFDDINFESAEFSRAFHVSAEDKRWAYDVLHPRAMQALLDAPRFSLQFDRGAAIAFRNRRFPPEAFSQAADLLLNLIEQLPDYVVQQQKAAA